MSLEVEGAAHYLPAYAGNLDIMTSAALRTAERIAAHRQDDHHNLGLGVANSERAAEQVQTGGAGRNAP
ncbi:hypothetical protein [Nonomuraea diastatica]|uniref:hypothetical protein n=1 Tax=Nonomuraea diastatica TaxID=1848329 RepID=UPI002482557B|nr:hypothetical protein [Nonomuraea diastatica]